MKTGFITSKQQNLGMFLFAIDVINYVSVSYASFSVPYTNDVHAFR